MTFVRKHFRSALPWVLTVLGAVALFLSWYGVSGQALTAKQLPYLVSGGLSGIALIIIAAAFFATGDTRRQLHRVHELEDKVDTLYRLLTEELAAKTGPIPKISSARPPAAGGLVALPSGSTFHLESCALVVGKPEAKAITARRIQQRALKPCKVCEPTVPSLV